MGRTNTPPGQEMSISDLNAFVYGLHSEMTQMKTWAGQVNDAFVDHAGRLDGLRISQIRGLQLDLAETKQDVKRCFAAVEANDAEVKKIIENVMSQMGAEVKALKETAGKTTEGIERLTNLVDGKIRELEDAVRLLRPGAASAAPADSTADGSAGDLGSNYHVLSDRITSIQKALTSRFETTDASAHEHHTAIVELQSQFLALGRTVDWIREQARAGAASAPPAAAPAPTDDPRGVDPWAAGRDQQWSFSRFSGGPSAPAAAPSAPQPQGWNIGTPPVWGQGASAGPGPWPGRQSTRATKTDPRLKVSSY